MNSNFGNGCPPPALLRHPPQAFNHSHLPPFQYPPPSPRFGFTAPRSPGRFRAPVGYPRGRPPHPPPRFHHLSAASRFWAGSHSSFISHIPPPTPLPVFHANPSRGGLFRPDSPAPDACQRSYSAFGSLDRRQRRRNLDRHRYRIFNDLTGVYHSSRNTQNRHYNRFVASSGSSPSTADPTYFRPSDPPPQAPPLLPLPYIPPIPEDSQGDAPYLQQNASPNRGLLPHYSPSDLPRPPTPPRVMTSPLPQSVVPLFQNEMSDSDSDEEADRTLQKYEITRPVVNRQQHHPLTRIKANNDKGFEKIYKKAVVITPLLLLHKEAAHQRKLAQVVMQNNVRMSAQLQRLPGGSDSAEGRDANIILPSEMWQQVLNKLTDESDLRNCSKTCRLFEEISNGNKTQWLFGKVLPFVAQWFTPKELRNCRPVCRQWRAGVNTYLEAYLSTDCTPRDGLDQPTNSGGLHYSLGNPERLHLNYVFTFRAPVRDNPENWEAAPVASSSTAVIKADRHWEAMRNHRVNPFIGRAVSIHQCSRLHEHVNSIRNFAIHAQQFLMDFGPHIYHLSISCEAFGRVPLEFHRVVSVALRCCTSLKSLRLQGEIFWVPLPNSTEMLGNDAAGSDFELVDRPSLETLQIFIKDPNIVILQDPLIAQYSAQLKRLEVYVWRCLTYSAFPWPRLVHLEVNQVSGQTLSCLKLLIAPNLHHLGIPVAGRRPHLQKLLQLTNTFPVLAHLQLHLESPFQGDLSHDDIIHLPSNLTFSSSLTTLSLTTAATDLLSFNFLLFFPFLRKFTLRHVTPSWEDNVGAWACSLLQIPTAENAPQNLLRLEAIKKTEIVKLVRYLGWPNIEETCGSRVYQSGIWSVLQYLQVLELCNARQAEQREKRKTFTRQGYEYFRQFAKRYRY